jgi:hypothetical protein
MSSRWQALFFLPLLLAGCLQEGPMPEGVHLLHSQTLASPGFIKVGDEVMVRCQDRRIPATITHGAVSDLWLSSFDGTRQRKAVTDWSDVWPEEAYSEGDRYYMVNERLVETDGGMARVADLLRLGPTLEEEFLLEGVWIKARFTVPLSALVADPQPGQTCPGFPRLKDNCPQIVFERPPSPGQKLPTLLLWNGEQELLLGSDSGGFQIQPMGNGTAYFILGEAHTLTRFVRPVNLMESLHDNVVRFGISGDERYAAVTLVENSKSRTVVLDFQNKKEIALARPNAPCCGGFGQDKFYYAMNATYAADGTWLAPAELHTVDLLTGEDTYDPLPSPLANLAGVLDRYTTDERLLLDSAGHGVFTSKSDLLAKRVVQGPLYWPSFTEDGKYLIYISPAAATLYDTTVQGGLMFQDAELAAPPILVSPPGLLVNAQSGPAYFFTDGDNGKLLIFWAHLGRESSDLYFADYTGGSPPIANLRIMAKSILSVSVSAHSLFGIVDMSQQDAVGNLVLRNFDLGTDRLYSQAVSEAAELGGADLSTSYAAYIVRGREDSERSGLWLTTLAPPVMPDGGSK